jgi:uncharacterized protein YcfJ
MQRVTGIAILSAVAAAGLGAAGVAVHRASANGAVAPVAAPAPTPATPEVAAIPAGVAAPVVTAEPEQRVQKTVVSRRVTTRRAPRYYVHKRSTKHSVAIIGGSTLGGAGIGALFGGKKGALIGGLVGGTAGTVYDRKTRKRVKRVE